MKNQRENRAPDPMLRNLLGWAACTSSSCVEPVTIRRMSPLGELHLKRPSEVTQHRGGRPGRRGSEDGGDWGMLGTFPS